MILNIFKNTRLKITAIFAIAVMLLLSSCEDRGCVEADDFGEYETFNVEVPSNYVESLCYADKSISDLGSNSQPIGFKQCFSQKCNSLTSSLEKNYCAKNCEIECSKKPEDFAQYLSGTQLPAGASSFSEPRWVSVGGANSITIEEDSQILINATGEISLGGNINNTPIVIGNTQKGDNGYKEDISTFYQDANKAIIKNGDLIDINFSGTYKDSKGTNYFSGAPSFPLDADKEIDYNKLNYFQSDYFNGAKTILAYTIKVPQDYNKYLDKTPLLPNPKSWICDTTSFTSDQYYLPCSVNTVDDYNTAQNAGFSADIADIFNKEYSNYYEIDNSLFNKKIFLNTGFIRHKNDGLHGTDDNWDSTHLNYKQIDVISLNVTNKVQVPYPYLENFKIKFITTPTCPVNFFKYVVEDENGAVINTADFIDNSSTTPQNTSTPKIIDVEKNNITRLFLTKNDSSLLTPNDCKVYALFFPYYDLKIDQSGFVSFGVVDNELSPIIANNCSLVFNIVNPTTNEKEYTTYKNHNVTNSSSGATSNNNAKYFVRRGQVIRFSPDSWKGTWTTKNNSLTKKCGVGFYIKHIPRPAVFCSKLKIQEQLNIEQDIDKTNDCEGEKYYDENLQKYTGCVENITKCYNLKNVDLQNGTTSDNSLFCPTECLPTKSYFNANCRPQTSLNSDFSTPPLSSCLPSINANCKTTCPSENVDCKTFVSYANIEPYKSMISSASGININSTFTETNCNNCITSLKNTDLKEFYPSNLLSSLTSQCYDLEGYTGTLDNLNRAINEQFNLPYSNPKDPLSKSYTSSITGISSDYFIKNNLKKLKIFDGNYGNLYPFKYTGENAINGNPIFKSSSTNYITSDSFIKFILLDANIDGNFQFENNNFYTNSQSNPSEANLKINLSSQSNKKNGQNLSVLICKDSGASGNNCNQYQTETLINQTLPVRLGVTSYNSSYQIYNNYFFNDLGYLTRSTSRREIDNGDFFSSHYAECDEKKSPYIGANYLCFKNPINTSRDKSYNNSYKISFKIFDEQVNDCNISNPSNPCSGTSCTGVKMPNINYNGEGNNICSNTSSTCTDKYFCVDRYQDNSGSYNVSVRINRNSQSSIAQFINSVISPILNVVDGDKTKPNQTKRIYESISNNIIYKSVLNLSIVLMFTFYGLGFLMGVSELKQSEIIDRLIKVGIIYLFTNPTYGWVWFEKFFVQFFKNGVDFLTFIMASIFDNSGQINTSIQSGDFSNKSALFSSVDKVINIFITNDTVHKKIGALFFYNLFGILYLMMIYYSAITYIYAISNAVLIYLTSQLFISILFIVGPIFFIFILFKQTKTYFDNWLNSMIGFGLQQIFLVFTLALFNTMIYMVIKMTLGFKVCWDSVWKISTIGGGTISLLSFWTVNDSPPYLSEVSNPSINGDFNRSTPSLPMILTLWILATMMKTFIGTITDLAATLSSGLKASELGANIAGAMNQISDKASKSFNKLYKKSGAQKALQTFDKNTFGSGELAKKERKMIKKENSANKKLMNKMEKNANKEVSKFKTENALEFSKLSESQKKETLMAIKKQAMEKTAKDAGKSPKEIRELMSGTQKGSPTDNILKAGLQAGIRGATGGYVSLNSKIASVDTGLSKNEMKDAMKNMNSDQRNEFIESAKSGNIQKSDKTTRSGSVTRNERQQAIKQLEDSGKITKQSFNGNSTATKLAEGVRSALSTRSPKEEDLISQQIQKNRIEGSFDKGSNMSGKEISKLESFAKYCDSKEGNNNSGKTEDKRKSVSNNSKNNREIKERGIEKLNHEKTANNEKIESAKNAVNDSQNKLSDIRASISSDDKHKQMFDLKNKLDSGKANDDDKKKYGEMLKEDRNREDGKETFDAKIEKFKTAKGKLNENKSNLSQLESKGDKIDNALEQAHRSKVDKKTRFQNSATKPNIRPQDLKALGLEQRPPLPENDLPPRPPLAD